MEAMAQEVVGVVVEPRSSKLFELGIFSLILFFFFVGMTLRSMIDKVHLTPLQLLAGGGIVFMTFAVPIGPAICESLTPESSLFAYLTACLPTFTFGVTAKEQLGKMLPKALVTETGASTATA